MGQDLRTKYQIAYTKATIIYSNWDWDNDKEQSLPDIRKDFMDAVDNCMDNNGNSSFCVFVENCIDFQEMANDVIDFSLPNWESFDTEEIDDNTYLFTYTYNAHPNLDLEDEIVQEEALKQCSMITDSMRRNYFHAKHNQAYHAMHYAFWSVKDWVEDYIESRHQVYQDEDPEWWDGQSEKEYVHKELALEFDGRTNKEEIIAFIQEGNYDSPEAETNMVNVFGTVIVVREW